MYCVVQLQLFEKIISTEMVAPLVRREPGYVKLESTL